MDEVTIIVKLKVKRDAIEEVRIQIQDFAEDFLDQEIATLDGDIEVHERKEQKIFFSYYFSSYSKPLGPRAYLPAANKHADKINALWVTPWCVFFFFVTEFMNFLPLLASRGCILGQDP